MRTSNNIQQLLFVIVLCSSFSLNGQISNRMIKPENIFNSTSRVKIKQVHLPATNNTLELEKARKMKEETCATCKSGYYGKGIDVDIDLMRDGTKLNSHLGTTYIIQITDKTAKGLEFHFDQFNIPSGGYLHIYSEDGNHKLGAFTDINNNPRDKFATQIIPANKVYIQYFQPIGKKSKLQINTIIHSFRSIQSNSGFENSGSCTVNADCESGLDEQKGVVMMTTYNNSTKLTTYCTGFLVNSDVQEAFKRPYLLTAGHCVDGSKPGYFHDAIFYFDYQSESCSNPSEDPINESMTMQGAYLITKGSINNETSTDYSLLELQNLPQQFLDVVYLGWERNVVTSNVNVNISHPNGDIKKIAKTSVKPTSKATADYCGNSSDIKNWEVTWSSGITGGGSSGSPLLNASNRVVGILHGGLSRCSDSPDDQACGVTSAVNGPDNFGKFSEAWNVSNLAFSSSLKSYLDPDNKNKAYLNSYDPPAPEVEPGTSTSGEGLRITFQNNEKKLFGQSTAIHNNIMAIGAPEENRVYIYEIVNCGANLQHVIVNPGSTGKFGYAVDIYENYIVVGAHSETDKGRAYVYKSSNGIWSKIQTLAAQEFPTADYFGYKVQINSDWIVVSCPNSRNGKGSIYVYGKTNEGWYDDLYSTGEFIKNESEGTFGYDLDLKGNKLAIGNPPSVVTNGKIGRAHYFELGPSGPGSRHSFSGNQYFGGHVALNGNEMAVYEQGKIKVYYKSESNWNWNHNVDIGETIYDIEFENNLMAVGKTSHEMGLYKRGILGWTEYYTILPHTNIVGYSKSIALSEKYIVAGSPENSGSNSGSAYIYSKYQTESSLTYSKCSTTINGSLAIKSDEVSLGGTSCSTDYLISSSGKLNVNSSDRITLKDGFKSKFGSEFKAITSYCTFGERSSLISPAFQTIYQNHYQMEELRPLSAKTSLNLLKHNSVTLYPNPSDNGIINVIVPNNNEEWSYVVTDISGNLLISGVSGNHQPLDLSKYRSSLVFLIIKSGESTVVKKVRVN